tara:strand:- start:1664 stop:3163 length:1500 start_codon:yes stop_codon:yes gene_type:complete
MEKFKELGLSKDVLEVLEKKGFTEPSEIQTKAIPLAMEGKDILGGSATGSGKTLAFGSPIIEKLEPNGKVQALILTPTRELADQVANSIKDFSGKKKLNIISVYGGVSIETQIRKIPKADIIVGTPGRILDHLSRGTLYLGEVKFLVLDEVDRMFDMGFYKDVEKILRTCPDKRQTMMFSATISSDIDHLAKKYTKDPVEISVESYVDPSKLTQIYYDTPNHLKFSLLVHLLKKEKSDLIMVFCSTRRNVDFVADNLKRNGIHAMAIHGGLAQNKRTKVIDDFHGKGADVLVCTDVAARGLDIKGVSHIYNYDLPSKSEDYIHRIGRTARAGKEGKAIIILSSRDYENFRTITMNDSLNIVQKDLPKVDRVDIKMNERPRRFDRGDDRRGPNRGGDRRGPSRGGDRRGGSRYGGSSRGSSRGGDRRSSGGSRYGGGSSSGGSRHGGGSRTGGNSRYGNSRQGDRRSNSSDSRGPSRGGDRRGPRSGSRDNRKNNSRKRY